MGNLKLLFGILLLGCLVTLTRCSKAVISSQSTINVDIEDGIYLIERTGNSIKEISPLSSNERRITFNKEFIEKTAQDEKYLVINKDEYAPLALREEPKTEAQQDNRKRLLLNLTNKAKEQLKDFTTKHINRLTTIVINGEALTKHKIREAIEGGQLQISRCTDNACELLYVELQDNVVKG